MKVVLSRDEIKQIVAETYGITKDFILEISSENATKAKQPEMITTVNSNNQVVAVEVKENSITRKPVTKGVNQPKTDISSTKRKANASSKKNYTPSNPKVDYEHYGIIIEDFLKSTGKTMSIDLENLTIAGMEYRYRTAAKLFGYSEKIKLHKDVKYNELQMSKR